jgi:hypothetical protein
LDALRKIAGGKPISHAMLRRADNGLAQVARARFGSWRKAARQAGVIAMRRGKRGAGLVD